jgi:hypothetical protein
MPNQRAAGQKLLTVPCDEAFIKFIDENLDRTGYSNRSQFVRDAIAEKLESLGIQVPGGASNAPSRIGKGGPVKYPEHKPGFFIMNEGGKKGVSSKTSAGRAKVLRRAAAGPGTAVQTGKP